LPAEFWQSVLGRFISRRQLTWVKAPISWSRVRPRNTGGNAVLSQIYHQIYSAFPFAGPDYRGWIFLPQLIFGRIYE
jgi:hypothetical protein